MLGFLERVAQFLNEVQHLDCVIVAVGRRLGKQVIHQGGIGRRSFAL